MRRHPWRGNLRELGQVALNAAVFALADALAAARRSPPTTPQAARWIPIPAKRVHQLLGRTDQREMASSISLPLMPQSSLRGVARELERSLYRQLFEAAAGDFRALARTLTGTDSVAAAKRVRLRFNQLGLRVRRKPR